MKNHETEMIAAAIAEIETSLRADLGREIGIGEETFTAEELLNNGIWKEDFCQWEEFHADRYEEGSDHYQGAFESWLEDLKSVYLG